MQNIITAQDIADFAPDLDTSAYNATTMSGIITQATHRLVNLANVKGFDFATETDEEDRALINNKGELVVSVKRRPITSVSSIKLVRGGFSTSLTLNDGAGNPYYEIPYPGNRLHLPSTYLMMSGTYLAGGQSQMLSLKGADLFCKVTYQGGYQTIPQDLVEATILMVRDIIAVKNNPAGVKSFNQGSYSVTFDSNGVSNLYNLAKTILYEGDYVKPEIF